MSMYERFSDRARKILQLANNEAQRFHHEYIGTEHILLGLVKEGSGVAANVLKNLGVDLKDIRITVENMMTINPGSSEIILGKLPQTPRTKKVIEYAIAESRNLNHNYVGSEHLLLGLLRETDGVACQALTHLGVTPEKFRAEVISLLSDGKEDPLAKEQLLLKKASDLTVEGIHIMSRGNPSDQLEEFKKLLEKLDGGPIIVIGRPKPI